MLTDRYDSFQGGQGGQGMQGGEVVLVSAPIQDENLRRLEQKIDLIMETQQQQMRGKPTMDQSKKIGKNLPVYIKEVIAKLRLGLRA